MRSQPLTRAPFMASMVFIKSFCSCCRAAIVSPTQIVCTLEKHWLWFVFARIAFIQLHSLPQLSFILANKLLHRLSAFCIISNTSYIILLSLNLGNKSSKVQLCSQLKSCHHEHCTYNGLAFYVASKILRPSLQRTAQTQFVLGTATIFPFNLMVPKTNSGKKNNSLLPESRIARSFPYTPTRSSFSTVNRPNESWSSGSITTPAIPLSMILFTSMLNVDFVLLLKKMPGSMGTFDDCHCWGGYAPQHIPNVKQACDCLLKVAISIIVRTGAMCWIEIWRFQ